MRTKTTSRATATSAIALAVGLVAGPAAAADLVPGTQPTEERLPPELSFDVTPYLWMAGLSGHAAAFGAPPVNVDESFVDILDSLNFAAMLATETRHDRLSLTTDFFYIKTTTGAETQRPFLADKVDLGTTTLQASALFGYAIVDQSALRLEAVAGPRLWHVEDTISFHGGLLDGRKADDAATWIDAMGGVKGEVHITDKVRLSGTALVGGGSSNIAWDILGGITYDISDRFSANVGYRGLGVDYDRDGFEFDVIMHGPMIGASLRF